MYFYNLKSNVKYLFPLLYLVKFSVRDIIRLHDKRVFTVFERSRRRSIGFFRTEKYEHVALLYPCNFDFVYFVTVEQITAANVFDNITRIAARRLFRTENPAIFFLFFARKLKKKNNKKVSNKLIFSLLKILLCVDVTYT